ncbi:MAG: M15 family metallopeptidase [Candidatus Acidiferrales bacterium]
MDAISEQRLALVAPVLATKIRQMADLLGAQNIYIRVVQGLRTVEEQDELYAQGRTTPGPIVTNAPGLESFHCYGLAVDCVPSINGVDQPYIPDWQQTHPSWKAMWTTGKSLGLTVGAYWTTFPDAPHFQVNGDYPVAKPSADLQSMLQEQGMPAVWTAVGVAA